MIRLLLITLGLLLSLEGFASDDEALPLLKQAAVEEGLMETRAPMGILLPVDRSSTLNGVPKVVWNIILHKLERPDLLRVRAVNVFLHNLVMTNTDVNAFTLLRTAGRNIRAYWPQDEGDTAQQVFVKVHRLVSGLWGTRLLNGEQVEQLFGFAYPLWKMRYLPGMNREECRQMLDIMGMDVEDNHWQALTFAGPYKSVRKGVMLGLVKVLIMSGLSAGSLSLTWMTPSRVADVCKTIYYLPAEFVARSSSNDFSLSMLAGPVLTTVTVGLGWAFYSFTCFDMGALSCFKCQRWGKRKEYGEMLRQLRTFEERHESRASTYMANGIKVLLLTAPLVTALVFTLYFGSNPEVSGVFTMAEYVHRCLKFNLPADPTCCAVSTSGYLGKGCPLINGDGVDFDQVVRIAKKGSSIIGMEIGQSVLTVFQILFVLVLTFIKFL